MTDVAAPRARSLGARRAFAGALAVLLGLAVMAQALGLFLKNVHWDEFIFLKNLYLYLNADLHRVFQTSYVHLFTWLPWVGGDEIRQIVAGRVVTFAGWLAALWLLHRLALRILEPLGALAAVALFALFSFSQYHAGSFRIDNLLLPVLLAMLLAASVPTPRRIVAAGALGGLGLALSIKAVLWAPAVLGLILVFGIAQPERRRTTLLATAAAALAALAVFAALLGLHGLTLAPASDQEVKLSGSTSLFSIFWEMFVAEGLFPRARLLFYAVVQNLFIWLLILSGVFLAIHDLRRPERRQRALQLLWLATPVLMLAVYHNAWAYAYLVLMPTACLLGGHAFGELATGAERRKRILAAVLLAGVALQGAIMARPNLTDGQAYQKQVLSLVHELFPEPVPYIDKTGMVSSFPREVFTMTTYGLRVYRAGGEAKVATYIREAQPPLLIANWRVLEVWPGGAAELYPPEDRLFPEDEEMLRRTYAPYWGPIYLAGRAWRDLAPGEERRFELTLPGTYTLLAEAPVAIDGQEVAPGDSLRLAAGAHVLTSLAAQGRARLLWGEDLEAPDATPPSVNVWGY